MGLQKVIGGLTTGIVGLMLVGCGTTSAGKSIEEISIANQTMGVSVHDPSIVKSDGKYYIFGSHMTAAVSDDLTSFKMLAEGVNAGNKLFDNLFTEDMEAFNFVGKYTDGGYAVWAPDVMYNPEMGKWVMYFSSSRDYRTSNICMATADNIEEPYSYQKTLLYSGYSSLDAEKTNLYEVLGADAQVKEYLKGGQYNNMMYPNCIDPCVFYDEENRLWMVYGSWSGGIWLLELDEATGLPVYPEADEENNIDAYYGKYLIGGFHQSCEGPYIIYNETKGAYYLFVSYGELTREGGYQIRQFRADNVTGPYVDATGETLGYTSKQEQVGIKVMGNYSFPSLKTAYMAPGHCSVLQDDDGKVYLVHHTRFDSGTEYHEPRVRQMFFNEDGWLVAAPFATMGERLSDSGFKDEKEISGIYYFVNHGTDISAKIHEAQEVRLKKDGSMEWADGGKGSYHVTPDSSYVTITLGEAVYKGVVIEMQDEAGNAVRCITAAGNNNESIWGVMYLQ